VRAEKERSKKGKKEGNKTIFHTCQEVYSNWAYINFSTESIRFQVQLSFQTSQEISRKGV